MRLTHVSLDPDGSYSVGYIVGPQEITRHISGICRCGCQHVLWEHAEDLGLDERENTSIPEHGCGIKQYACTEFRCTKSEHARLRLPE